MKLKSLLLLAIFALAPLAHGTGADASAKAPAALLPERYEAKAAHLAAEVLSRYHYKAVPLDSTLSEKIFDQYLKALDNDKYYFVQADIDQLAAQRSQLGNAILKEDLSLPFAIFNLYERRVVERFAYARTLLTQPMNFELQEDMEVARSKQAWPQSEAALRDLWRKRVKNDWLRLKIAGKDSTSIAAILDKRYAHAMQRITRIKSDDAFQTFMNAYTMSIDPHTNYMGPKSAEEFDIAMRLSLTGIGATLAESEDYVTIVNLIAGGPAYLSGQLQVGDRIVGVAQGADGAMVDILGWRQDEAVDLIRGAADSVVRLEILPQAAAPDAPHRQISLVRKAVRLEEQAAKSSVQVIAEGALAHRIGVITLPSFYEDFAAKQADKKDYRSATRDVARLLEQLKQQNVESVLVDLRNNGGGSLTEALGLTGLFIGAAPVVQQRKANGSVSVEQDAQARVAWTGPLGVLINRHSASASEIFAAAIQDYGRGLVIGDPSFGKGTVQSMVDLDRIAGNEQPRYGELKLTVAQFFRVNGGTTQLRGVLPDVPLQSDLDDEDSGESSYANALPWVQTRAADYAPFPSLKPVISRVLEKHSARMKSDADLQQLQAQSAQFKLERTRNTVSLNEAVRRKEREVHDALLAARSGADPAASTLPNGNSDLAADDGLQPDERSISKSLSREKLHKEAKDIPLLEAARVLSDELEVRKADAQWTPEKAAFQAAKNQ